MTKQARQEQDTFTYEDKNKIDWVKFNRPEKRHCMNPKLNRQMLFQLGCLPGNNNDK